MDPHDVKSCFTGGDVFGFCCGGCDEWLFLGAPENWNLHGEAARVVVTESQWWNVDPQLIPPSLSRSKR